MSRQFKGIWTFLSLLAVAVGCHPTQPYYLFEDGDLSHYLDVAMEIETPNVDTPVLNEMMYGGSPLTLDNMDQVEFWDITLQDAVHHTLQNGEFLRKLGGRVAGTAPDEIARSIINPFAQSTIYDPALAESAYGGSTGATVSNPVGVEAALSEFDARLDSSLFWEKNDRPQNFGGFPDLFTPSLDQDLGRFTAGLSKANATGGVSGVRLNTTYDSNNSPTRALISDWNTNIEATINQPLLQGFGVEYGRIVGPVSFNQAQSGFLPTFDGVVIARIRTDQTLADFEGGVRDLVKGIEESYWELYFAYRDLDAKTVARDSALRSWRVVDTRVQAELESSDKEALARAQYFEFKAQVETALTELQRAEGRLRYIMGLAPSDGRVLRPIDEPSLAQVTFDPFLLRQEALHRRVEIRKQKWEIKERELQLIAAKNHLLPRLDAVARYRYTGLGDDLIDSNRTGLGPIEEGSNSFETLTGGDFQEWQIGLQLETSLGKRREMAAVKHHQFLIAQACTILRNLEFEIVLQVDDSYRNVVFYHNLINTNFQRYLASKDEVEVALNLYNADVGQGTVTLDLLLDAQRRLAVAESQLFRAVVDYNLSIMSLHYRKGSLLEYDGVYLAEGDWPAKAYFDAMREARKRDAGKYFDYGVTEPGVVTRGAYHQRQGAVHSEGELYVPTEAGPEVIEAPMPDTLNELEEMPMPSPAPASLRLDGFGSQSPAADPFGDAALGVVQASHTQVEPTTTAPAKPTADAAEIEPAAFEGATNERAAAPRGTIGTTVAETARPAETGLQFRSSRPAARISPATEPATAAANREGSSGRNEIRASGLETTSKVADETVSNHTSVATPAAAANRTGTQRSGSGPNLRR
jgi:outer membrane protein TolC